MAQRWSEQIERRYALRLSPELRAWLDEEIWSWPTGGEFRDPLSPAEILEPPPGIIWAGFMLPDTLPLIGNDYGDWLCVRVDASGQAGEIIGWNHGGGDWIPYGRNLAEALLYDAVAARKTNPQPGGLSGPGSGGAARAADWACRWLWSHGALPGPSCPRKAAAVSRQQLLAQGIAEVALRRDLAVESLNNPLRERGEPALAEQMNVRWDPDFLRWAFDTDLIPPPARAALARVLDRPLEQLLQQLLQQDWAAAENEALAVIRLRRDLGWPYHLAGWAAERRGDAALAIERYVAGLSTSLFADEGVRFRTHWYPDEYGKFAAARLAALRPQLPSALLHDPYLRLFWEQDAASLRIRLRQHWLQAARQHYRCAQYLQAFCDFYRAGWDCGSSDLDGYAEILDGLDASAEAAGAVALARVVQTHRSCLPA